MDKSKCKWVYPVAPYAYERPTTHWVYEVDNSGPGVEEVWLVDDEFNEKHWKDVEHILFVGELRKDSPHTKKVHVAGWDPVYSIIAGVQDIFPVSYNTSWV